MAPESIIEKVQKLIQFQKGAEAIGSLEEAANAAEKVQTLLLKYNLEMADITAHDPEKEQKMGRMEYREVYAKKNEGRWTYRLYTVLAEHNLCDVVLTSFVDKHGRHNLYVNLIGTKENVTVVKFLADQLENRIRILEKSAWDNIGRHSSEKRNAFRRGYFMGACTGINTQLREAKRRAMQVTEVYALVLANDIELRDAVNNLFPYLRQGKRSRNLSAATGQALGFADGRNININKGIGHKENGTKYLN